MDDLSPAARSALTLAVLALLVVIGLVWGLSKVTAPLPGLSSGSSDACSPLDVAKGDVVRPGMVQVSVYNAGTRNGLAGDVMDALVERGFVEGNVGDAPDDADVAKIQIWADDKSDPAVQLLRRQIAGPAPITDRAADVGGTGVVLVVGDAFGQLGDVTAKVTAKTGATLCQPVAKSTKGPSAQ
ncbi:LytR C-terminal domain-containing protein [Nocardioides acrostichi]|uniref:LytR C-terminal domain-containing protein n=1 Tax=Nocardioides acrostichi TaxID=2784339 RepID=A0A930YCI8_9ACTN|nr:LytR C-terminal domain-containing protein [Nocardioides acrostichi]MBF4163538.1 LytR C-terminal domain-containing protein [Nocardioides acrostichi]